MYKFNVITTYLDDEQDIFDIELNYTDVKNEETFLNALFESEMNVKSIIKYSVFQFYPIGVEEFLPFLVKRKGKFYFNEDDAVALNIKNMFLETSN